MFAAIAPTAVGIAGSNPSSVLQSMGDDVRPSTWITAAIVGLVLLVLAIVAMLPSGQRFLLARASRSAALPVPPHLEREVLRPQLHRIGGLVIGGLVGLFTTTVFVWYIGADRGSPAVALLIAGSAVGASFGASVVGLGGALSRGSEGIRVAHAHRRGLRDYAPFRERIVVRLTVLVATAIVVVTTILSTSGDFLLALFPAAFSPAAIVTALALIALGAFEIGGRFIAQRPSATTSELGLAWTDTLRSGAIRGLAASAFLLGMFAVLFGFGEIVAAVAAQSGALNAGLGYYPEIVVVILLIAAFGGSARSHYSRTLHSSLDLADHSPGDRL
ncbi:hypothetical protein B0I08_11327 [Glaciihabitans tibetensis]|uniref:Uncharacterized protein n=1 Tax=Glaciihabitans tibetensis TaxID=1266600 RepID=A0A2T0V2C1_9MICO|nr:hypothetical protein [Glaciihabitans tibetensis]PRY64320.1 hypothetical protein B0I08_11327 [Glaciihabitans tibetensis]